MGRGSRRPFSAGGPEVLVAVDGLELMPEERRAQLTAGLVAALPDLPVVVIPATQFADPDSEADLYLGFHQPTAPGLEVVVQYRAEHGRTAQFEQHSETGAVFREGVEVWPDAPVAVSNLRGGDTLEVLSDGALFFAAPDGRMRITTIPDIVWVCRTFRTRPPAPGEYPDPRWEDLARASLRPASLS